MIIETTANQFYQVTEIDDPNLAHCWWGVPVKRSAKFGWVQTAKAARAKRAELVSKAHCLRVVQD